MHVTSTRCVLADHAEYAAARADVETLTGRGFPREHLTIVGADLCLQEWTAGRRSQTRRTAGAAALGVFIGLSVAVMALLAGPSVAVAMLACVIAGGAIGALAAHRYRFASYRIVPGRHQVLVSQGWADDARLLLDRKTFATFD